MSEETKKDPWAHRHEVQDLERRLQVALELLRGVARGDLRVELGDTYEKVTVFDGYWVGGPQLELVVLPKVTDATSYAVVAKQEGIDGL